MGHELTDRQQGGPFQAYANVVRGGNRMMKVTAHVVCRDANGQVRFERDAEVFLPIPAGEDVPQFQCDEVTAFVLPPESTEVQY